MTSAFKGLVAALPPSVPCSDRPHSRPHLYPGISGLRPITGPGDSAGPGVPAPATTEGRPEGPDHRVSLDQLRRLSARLSDRDWQILHTLSLHRYLTTTQVEQFHFRDHDSQAASARVCRRVLARLAELRVIEHLDRRIGGTRAGSSAFVWRVGLIGDRLLRLDRPDQPRSRLKEPSLRHLDHCLAVADIHLALRAVSRVEDDVDLMTVQGEPACWRRYENSAGVIELLKPDFAATTASAEYQDSWFIELDRGTESLPTLLRKCAQYEAYRHTGIEQDRNGVFPAVVWVMSTNQAVVRLAEAITSARDLTADLFRVCTINELGGVVRGNSL